MATLTEPVMPLNKASTRVIEFKGYNCRGDIEDGEMRDMLNLCADEYPHLYQRPARGRWNGCPDWSYPSPRSLLVKSHFRANGSTVVSQEAKLAVIDGGPELGGRYLVKEKVESASTCRFVIVAIYGGTPTTNHIAVSSLYDFTVPIGDMETIDGRIETTSDVSRIKDMPGYQDSWKVADRDDVSLRLDPSFQTTRYSIYVNESRYYTPDLDSITDVDEPSYAFYYDGVKYLDGLSADTQMVAINTKICFFPEKKFFRLVCDENQSRIGDIDADLEIDEGGTCHIGPNEDFNFISSTLTLPDDYVLSDYGFEVGDAVDIEVTSAPVILLRKTAKIEKDSKVYGCVYFIRMLKIGSKYQWKSNLSCWKSTHYASPNETWTSSTAYSEMMTAYNSLETYDGYLNLLEQRESLGSKSETLLNMKTISANRIKSIYGKSNGDVMITYSYDRFGLTSWAFVTFDGDEIVDYSSSGEYVANGVAPVSGIIQDINGTKITLGDNSFNNLLGQQFDDVDVPFNSISIKRVSPDLDFVMEYNNRLWGVSNRDNTIYASKLGDPTNWSYFQNTSMDSYYAEQGSDGEWTGVASYSSHLLFFKEDCIHKLYGSFPAEYQIQTAICNGVEKGSSKSIVFMNDAIVYKSRVGIMAYGGGRPELISSNFGNTKYKNVVAGTDGRRYYACLEDKNGGHVLMCFDTEMQEWHKQDTLNVQAFAFIGGKVVYALKDTPDLYEMESSVPLSAETSLPWMAQFGPYDEYVADKKVYSRIKLVYRMPAGSEMKVYYACDDDYDNGTWTLAQYITTSADAIAQYADTMIVAEPDRTQEVFITPIRCDQFAIKLEGTGYCRVKSMYREYRQSTMKKENY